MIQEQTFGNLLIAVQRNNAVGFLGEHHAEELWFY